MRAKQVSCRYVSSCCFLILFATVFCLHFFRTGNLVGMAGAWRRGNEFMAISKSTGAIAAIVFMWTLLFSRTEFVESVESGEESDQPKKDVEYYQIWASQDGETHFAKCTMQGFNLSVYASLPQYLRSDFGGEPLKVVVTELTVGMVQPLHSPPQVQFVVTLSGSWYIQTSDGTRHEFEKGDVLFQDNTKTSPAAKQPEHYSGTVGDEPCHQLVVQISRPPQVDNPCPF